MRANTPAWCGFWLVVGLIAYGAGLLSWWTWDILWMLLLMLAGMIAWAIAAVLMLLTLFMIVGTIASKFPERTLLFLGSAFYVLVSGALGTAMAALVVVLAIG
jgi:hypothetical protein